MKTDNERNQAIVRLQQQGWKEREIGDKFKISKQRVAQILDALAPDLSGRRRTHVSGKLDQLYLYLVSYKQAHNGNSPSIREIIDANKLSTCNRAYIYLNKLMSDGRIVFRNDMKRTCIEIPGARWFPPVRGYRSDSIITDDTAHLGDAASMQRLLDRYGAEQEEKRRKYEEEGQIT